MASSELSPLIAPKHKWRREWYYLGYSSDHFPDHDLIPCGGLKLKHNYLGVTCTDCYNKIMFVDFSKHRRTCFNEGQGCNWAYLCKEHSKHLNVSPNERNWLDGCDYTEVRCIYCPMCEPAKRYEIKKKLEDNLEEKDFRLVLAMVWEARSKWYNIGLELGISSETLECIRANDRDDTEKCFVDMIKRWLQSDEVENKSFKALVRALKSPSVGREQVAEDMEKSEFHYACRVP